MVEKHRLLEKAQPIGWVLFGFGLKPVFSYSLT